MEADSRPSANLKLLGALAKIAREMHNPNKDAVAKGVGYRYVELDALLNLIRPIAAQHGVIILQHVVNDRLVTELWHEDGEGRTFEMPLKIEIAKNLSEAQQLGKALTYARKYSLMALFAIHGGEDDDAQPASKPMQSNPKSTYATEQSRSAPETLRTEDLQILDDPLFNTWIEERSSATRTEPGEFRRKVLADISEAAHYFRTWKENR